MRVGAGGQPARLREDAELERVVERARIPHVEVQRRAAAVGETHVALHAVVRTEAAHAPLLMLSVMARPKMVVFGTLWHFFGSGYRDLL